MTMYFRTIKTAITTLLSAQAAGRYRVKGYPDQNLSAEELADTDRLVQVNYIRGEFPKSRSGFGPYDHHMTMRVRCLVSQAATVDLSVLDDPASSAAQRATALAAAEPAAEVADNELDALIDAVFQVLMAGTAIDLGMAEKIGEHWLPNIDKVDPYRLGDRVVVAANLDLMCHMTEEVPSAALTDLEDIDVSIQHQGDAVTRAGVKAEY